MSEAGRITVHVKYGDVEQTFNGSVESVWLSVNKFFAELIPALEIASKLVLSIDLQKLLKDCEGIIAFSAEGPSILVPRNKLTDNEILSLLLLASHIGYRLGRLQNDAVSRDELLAKLGKAPKIMSTRLGELVRSELAAKTADEKYRITTFGITQMQKEILPRAKRKQDSSLPLI